MPMLFRFTLSFLILLFISSCNQQPSKNVLQGENDTKQEIDLRGGLQIANSIRRGAGYTDSLGTEYNHRYIPITITNKQTFPVHLELDFSPVYDYQPNPEASETFRLVPLPKEWALIGVGITENMLDELPQHINQPYLSETIAAGDSLVLAIGALYDKAPVCGIIPEVLFMQDDSDRFPACDSRMSQNESTTTEVTLGLKLDYCGGGCLLIPCGRISYQED